MNNQNSFFTSIQERKEPEIGNVLEIRDELEIMDDLGKRNGLEMYLQFIVSTDEEKIVAAEALSRWNSFEDVSLRPGQSAFHSLSEDDELERDLYIFEKVCKKLSEWTEKGWRKLKLSCNLARSDFSDSFLAERLISIAQRYSFPRDNLVIEITEDTAEKSYYFMSRILRRLKEFGFRIALDDFGAGAASIKDIQLLPLDILKLDRSLLRYAWSPAGERVFREVTEMGKRLQNLIVCEGVETEAEMQIAKRAGVDAVQGFLHYVPIPEAEADQLLEQYFGWIAIG